MSDSLRADGGQQPGHTDRIDATPTGWKVAGIVFTYAVFFTTFYGIPYVPFLPPLGMGVTDSVWFFVWIVVFTPLFLLGGSYAGNVLMMLTGRDI